MSKMPSAAEEPQSLAYPDAWVQKLRRHLPEAVKTWDADAIHQSRVATRRLKAALDVADPILSKGHGKSLSRVLRKLRRQLGPLRDLDVMLGHLAGFRSTPGVIWLGQRLDDVRADDRRDVADALRPAKILAKLEAWEVVRLEWAEAGDAVDGLLANSVHLQLDAFADQANGLSPGQAADADRDPHELRIAGKALRYTLEMAVAGGHPLAPDVAKGFKRMQDALGAWHDMIVLGERALRESLDTQLAYHHPALHLSVLDLARTAVQRSQRHMAAIATLWVKQGPSLSDTIRATFAISTEGATEPPAGPDQPGSEGRPAPVPPDPAGPAAA